MYTRKEFCAKRLPEMCFSHTNLPNCYLKLQPNYSLIEFEEFRKVKPKIQPMAKIREFKLDIRYTGEYKACLLPTGGLNLLYHPSKNDNKFSSQEAFNSHKYEFMIKETIYFDHISSVQKVPCSLEHSTKAFIGDVTLLTDNMIKHGYRTVVGDYFNRVYMDDQLIGYSLSKRPEGFDNLNGNMYSNEGFFGEIMLRYTDKATRTVDGIILTGLQNENW